MLRSTYPVLLALFASSPVAAAPVTCASVRQGACMQADTFSLEFDPQGQPLAIMNFGLFAALPSSNKFQTVCEEAFGGRTPEKIAVTGAKILIPSRQGVYFNSDSSLCTWEIAKGLPANAFVQHVVPDPTVLSRVWALVGAGDERSLYLSEDQGVSFSVRHQWKRGTAWWRLHVHPTGKLYVSGPGLVGPFAIGISVDEGKTFKVLDPVPDLADAQKTTTLVEVSASDPPRLYFGRDTASGRDEVLLSQDEGQSVKSVLLTPSGHFLGGFTFGATQDTVYVGSRAALVTGKAGDGALFVSLNGGVSWEQPILSAASGPRFRCLGFRNGHLFACGGGVDARDAAYLAKSVDGVNWASVATMSQVEPPATCMRSMCLETTSWLCLSYGVCPEALPDAGPGDAGGPTTSESSGCGCRFGGGSSRSSSLLALALALLIQCHSRLKSRRAQRDELVRLKVLKQDSQSVRTVTAK